MKTFQWVTSLSVVTLLLVSCTGESKVTTAPSPEPSVGQAPVAPNPPSNHSETVAANPNLQPSTDPETLKIATGRSNPFQTVVVPPIKLPVTGETAPQAKAPQPNNPQAKAPQPNNPQPKASQPNNPQAKAPQPNNPQPKASQPNNPQPKPETSEVETERSSQQETTAQNPPLPSIPSTDLADAVQVNGVMQVGGRVNAIVKEPNEKTSRYVSVGEYLSQGKILVKRIELGGNAEPQVILEQNCVEVVKSVSSNGPVASAQ
ncbi:MAG: hypothetical protein LDL41_00105 [Coleofasciculus sp. S288]|nr:hypothetical protein [Coleofasciculus sp. S288]